MVATRHIDLYDSDILDIHSDAIFRQREFFSSAWQHREYPAMRNIPYQRICDPCHHYKSRNTTTACLLGRLRIAFRVEPLLDDGTLERSGRAGLQCCGGDHRRSLCALSGSRSSLERKLVTGVYMS